MTPYYLRFSDEKEANSVIPFLRQMVSSVDVVGSIYNDDGTYDGSGNIITNPTMKEGYHVNVLSDTPLSKYQEYLVDVVTPSRRWLGM